MEIVSSQASTKFSIKDFPSPQSEPSNSHDLLQFKWTEEIGIEEGFSELEKHFYPFKKVNIMKKNRFSHVIYR